MQLDQNDKQAVAKFHSLIKEKLNVKKMILFGSRARGDASLYSDIDLLVLYDQKPSTLKEYHKLANVSAEVSIDYGVALNCVYANYKDWELNKEINPALKANVDKKGIDIVL